MMAADTATTAPVQIHYDGDDDCATAAGSGAASSSSLFSSSEDSSSFCALACARGVVGEFSRQRMPRASEWRTHRRQRAEEQPIIRLDGSPAGVVMTLYSLVLQQERNILECVAVRTPSASFSSFSVVMRLPAKAACALKQGSRGDSVGNRAELVRPGMCARRGCDSRC